MNYFHLFPSLCGGTVSFGLQALPYEPSSAAQPTVTHHLHRFPQRVRSTIAYHECHARGIPLRNNSTIDARTAGRLRRSLCHFIGRDFQRRRHDFIQGKFPKQNSFCFRWQFCINRIIVSLLFRTRQATNSVDTII